MFLLNGKVLVMVIVDYHVYCTFIKESCTYFLEVEAIILSCAFVVAGGGFVEVLA